jgi:hypothetical protein
MERGDGANAERNRFTMPQTMRVEAAFSRNLVRGGEQQYIMRFDVIGTQRVQDLEALAKAKLQEEERFHEPNWAQHATIKWIKVIFEP